MFEVSLRWQDGAIQLGIYVAAIVAILWLMSKIRVSGGGESPIGKEKGNR